MRNRWRFAGLSVAFLVVGCGRTMCDIPDVNSPEVGLGFHIQDYGPRHAKAGEGFNLQPDGSSAMWFKLDESVSGSEVRVHFGEMVIAGDISKDVVTIKVPDAAHAKPGKIAVMLEKREGADVSKSNTVTIDLDNP